MFFLFWLVSLSGTSQNIIQSKKFKINNFESFRSITKHKSHYYLGHYSFSNRGDSANVRLAKLSANLDTIWSKKLGGFGRPLKLYIINDTVHFIYDLGYSVVGRRYYSGIGYIKTDTNGNVLTSGELFNPFLQKITFSSYLDKDSSIIVTGSSAPSLTVRGYQCDWFVYKLDRHTMNPIWSRYYNPGASGACECFASPSSTGHIIVSGMADTQVKFMLVNSANGDTVRTFPPIRGFSRPRSISDMSVSELPDKKGYLFFMNDAAQGIYYLKGQVDTAGREIWRQEKTYGMLQYNHPRISPDGSYVVLQDYQVPPRSTIELTRYSRDTTIMWRRLIATANANRISNLYDYYFEDDSSAVLVGWLGVMNNFFRDTSIILRVSNIGRPYNPLSVPGQVVGPREVLVPYPNPVRGASGFQLRGLTHAGELVVYTLTGQEVARLPVQPDQPIQLPNLRPGVYLGRVGGRAFRFLVE